MTFFFFKTYIKEYVLKLIFMIEKKILIFFNFLRMFENKYPIFLKSITKIAPLTQATRSKKSSFSEFSHGGNLLLYLGKLPKIKVI